MDTNTCTTIVLVLLWLHLCCQALGSLVAIIRTDSTSVLSSTTTLSTLLLGACLWQCKKAGYLVSQLTWYHWVLLALLVLLQVGAVIMAFLEQLSQQSGGRVNYGAKWKYPIYGVAAALVVLLGGTLFCGWKCNLFCRPCCKSQYVCYSSAIVVVLVVLALLAFTAHMIKYESQTDDSISGDTLNKGQIEKAIIGYLDKIVVPITQCYAMAVLWHTTLKLPYTIAEVVALVAAAVSVASILAFALPTTMEYNAVLSSTTVYPLLALNLVSLGMTWYFVEYKAIFCCQKEYLCFGVVAAVLVVALIAVSIEYANTNVYRQTNDDVKYTLVGYSILLMIPTLWYAYRCGLLTWCIPKKKGLKATDTAENTTTDSDIAKES